MEDRSNTLAANLDCQDTQTVSNGGALLRTRMDGLTIGGGMAMEKESNAVLSGPNELGLGLWSPEEVPRWHPSRRAGCSDAKQGRFSFFFSLLKFI